MTQTAPSHRTGAIPRALDPETIDCPSGGNDPRRRAVADRSVRAEVRNPLLRLRATKQILALPPEARRALAALLHDLSLDARERAQQSWSRNKAPMAVYWKVVSVYAGNLHRVVRPTMAEMAMPTHAYSSRCECRRVVEGEGA